jgi:serine/threonine protein kinase
VISVVDSPSNVSLLVDSFLNEVKQSKKLATQSKHVVKMFDFDFHKSGLAFIVMERGNQDLEKALIKKSTLPISQQKFLWKQILNILVVLHKHSVVCLHVILKNNFVIL